MKNRFITKNKNKMSCRCVSVNSQLEHEFNPNMVYPQAILIDDINEDNKNEIVIGTANGEIFIYKGSLFSPWLKYSKQVGSIICMAFDTVTNSKRRYLIVHDALGYVYLLSINQVYTRRRYASDLSSAKSNPTDWKLDLRPIYQAKLLVNPKHLIIDDLYNNGTKQMIVQYADRTIKVFNWVNNSIVNSSITNSSFQSNNPFQENGYFLLEQSWELPDLIFSIHVVKDFLNGKDLIATQPGGRAYLCKSVQTSEPKIESNSSSSSSLTDLAYNLQSSVSVKSSSFLSSYEELINFSNDISLSDLNRNAIPTYLVTNVCLNKCNQYAYLITISGDIYFYKLCPTSNIPNKAPLWHRSINIIVMKYYKIDVNNDGNDELMLATPDGQIYVINYSGEVLCFDLGEPIRAFHIGFYSSELFTSSLSLVDPGTSSQVDLYQPNPAFELALDASSISFQNDESSSSVNNSLCVVFISSITNKICLLQTDSILPYSKTKPSSSQFRYRCENVFSNMRLLNPKLVQLFEKHQLKGNQSLMNDIVHDILYSNSSN